MKTTLDLPDELVKRVKLRAIHEGRKLKDAVADLLRKGLDLESGESSVSRPAAIVKDKKSGLPVIQCRHAAAPNEEMTPDRVAQILIDQEAGWHDVSG